MKYRKKPVVIEAAQWFKHGDHPAVKDMGAPVVLTLEGPLHVTPGDWIITGVKGEHYPCKPDVFAATYEPAENTITAPEGWKLVPTTVLQSAMRALEESVDLVQSEYDTNWRQGVPTRKGQLDAMLLELVNHKDAIELLKKVLGDSDDA